MANQYSGYYNYQFSYEFTFKFFGKVIKFQCPEQYLTVAISGSINVTKLFQLKFKQTFTLDWI